MLVWAATTHNLRSVTRRVYKLAEKVGKFRVDDEWGTPDPVRTPNAGSPKSKTVRRDMMFKSKH